MNPEDTIRHTLYYYPQICPNRAHALHHMFCVIGNGYEWIKGELVDPYMELTPHPKGSLPHNIPDTDDGTPLWKLYSEINKKHIAFIEEMNATIEQRMVATDFDRKPYPPAPDYAYLWNPKHEQMTAEWSACWIEARKLFLPLYELFYGITS